MDTKEGKKINKNKIIPSICICIIGIIVCVIFASMTTYVNGGVWIGILTLMAGTVAFMYSLYKEVYRIGIEMPILLDSLFPNYPIVEDSNNIDYRLSGFRKALDEFLCQEGIVSNSTLQSHASQVLWHSIYLWKKRMDKKGVTLSIESNRRAYTSKKNSVRVTEYFDGRYEVSDAYEEIDSTRTFHYKGRTIKTIEDKEVAHYTLLSAKETEDDKIICPNCGGITTKTNLIDGCDYCGTKFTVEEMKNNVSFFGFRHDFQVNESKREAIKSLIYPWVFILTEMPFVYFGFFGAFLYMKESIIARVITGLVAAGLLGLLGFFFTKINMVIVTPIAMGFDASKKKSNMKYIYRSEEADDKEKNMAEYVRRYDSKFSIQSFFGGVQNKLFAVHFADLEEEINAFSDVNLSNYLKKYQNVIDVDILSMDMESYELREGSINEIDGLQNATVSAELVLREIYEEKIKEKTEKVEVHLSKNGRLRTQAVCAPALMKCEKCGASRLLVEGKKCSYCGHELDMKKYDWVITDYRVI